MECLYKFWNMSLAMLLSLQLVCSSMSGENEGIFITKKRVPYIINYTEPRLASPPPLNRPAPCPTPYTHFERYRSQPVNTILNLTNTGLKKIGDLFVRSPNIKELYLDDNEITEISILAFEELTGLEVLSLSGNNISVNELLRFKKHENLQRIVIDNNKRESDGNSVDYVLQSLPRLQEISLRRDRISMFNVHLKEFAPRLTRLDLSENKIKSTEFLDNLPERISYLNLDNNTISSLQNTNSNTLANIEQLFVSRNKIAEMCTNSCSDMSLSLKGLTKLSVLNVSHNRISRVSKDAFIDTTKLTILDLSYNKIDRLPSDCFTGLTSMKEVHLSNNRFASVPNICLLTKLQHLDLSHNYIMEVNNFCALPYLQTLLLSSNHIISIASDVFINLQMLQTFDLSNNAIVDIPVNLITRLPYLQTLSLKNNSITNIEQLFNERSTSLRELHLEGNPLLSFKIKGIPQLTVHLSELKSCNGHHEQEESKVSEEYATQYDEDNDINDQN